MAKKNYRTAFSLATRVLAATFCVFLLGQIAVAQNTRQEPTVRERLVFGLQARRPVEIEYVDAVIDTVNRGDLPQPLVDRVFFWASTRPARRGTPRRPIIYFQAALDRIAAKMRIEIEPTP